MKKLLIILLLCFPLLINAKESVSCDYEKKNELALLSNSITYETSYIKAKNTFNITFYNVISGLNIEYDTKIYSGNNKNQVTLTNIPEGKYLSVSINTSGINCDPFLRTVNVKVPYYNDFYGSRKCEFYKDKLTLCNSKFLSYELTEELLDKAIENLEGGYQDEPEPEPVIPDTPFEIVLEFVQDYGIKIALICISSMITITIFNVIYRKIKHKI